MAEPVNHAISVLTPTASLPTTSSPRLSSNNTSDNFLKPTSPRKRRRSSENSSISSTIDKTFLAKTFTPRTPKFDSLPKTPERPSLTAVAELAEQKRRKDQVARGQVQQQTSPNHQKRALVALMGGQENNMSKPQDAPNPVATPQVATKVVAPTISIPEENHGDGSIQTSPVSMSSLTTVDSIGITTTTANAVQVASPGQMTEELGGPEESDSRHEDNLQVEKDDGYSNKALTFPGPLLSAQVADTRRGMSLPHSGFSRDESRSPSGSSAKKHKCPYCSTDFTRHHNLKSHLLTHSHEKPYMCQTCDSRFRRLHDLKRHTKLHTGERPHVCPKCKRSFARGDALARHNKGQGGCAGRRSSVGSYGGDGPFDGGSQGGHGGEEGMDGLIYTGEASHEPENMDDDPDEDRRKSLPSIRRQEAPLDPHYQQTHDNYQSHQSRQPSTYPPVAVRQATTMGGGLYPPNASHGASSSTSTSPGQTANMGQYPAATSGSSTYQSGGSNVFAQGGMTESPKPLSPAGLTSHQHGHADSNIHRNRSPSLTQQFQQHQYGRRAHGRGTSPPIGLPPPMTSSANSNTTHLPSLPSLNPPDSRYTLHSQPGGGPSHGPPISQSSLPGPPYPSGGATPSSYHSQQGGLSSQSNSHSSHGTQAHGSERGNPSFPQPDDRLWAYVRSLEQKVDRLQEEVHGLRGQINTTSHR